mmetsp:Transcript_6797/g.20634  ORF Transcript_6797/g.20634 Transcript_6797/m.20634 type:complete len:172 (+) Transcript_6797:1323-1838(+)
MKRWMSILTHLGREGQPRMVDVGSKAPSKRTAEAFAQVLLGAEIFRVVSDAEEAPSKSKKGSVLFTAQLAGIMGAKRTADLIPLCHPVPLTHVGVDLSLDDKAHSVVIRTTATTASAQTGVEMEALSAASVAALTVYDMCKAAGKGIVISEVKLLRKSGGRSGDYERREEQ